MTTRRLRRTILRHAIFTSQSVTTHQTSQSSAPHPTPPSHWERLRKIQNLVTTGSGDINKRFRSICAIRSRTSSPGVVAEAPRCFAAAAQPSKAAHSQSRAVTLDISLRSLRSASRTNREIVRRWRRGRGKIKAELDFTRHRGDCQFIKGGVGHYLREEERYECSPLTLFRFSASSSLLLIVGCCIILHHLH